MEFFKANPNIDFMGQRKYATIFSILICLVSLIILVADGLDLGLDFTGGTQIEASFDGPADFDQIRADVAKAGFPDALVQPYGSSTDVIVRIGEQEGMEQKELQAKIAPVFKGGTIRQIDYIGPQVGRAMVTNGILAIVVSLLGTMLYVAMRFEYRFAFSAAVALIHDPIVTLGVFALFQIEFNLISLAAVLTIIGYSINDTIVVYDRVRENMRRIRKGTVIEIMNKSINQTLSRTIMTSGLTLIVVVVLFVFGGEVLRGFSLALIIGIVIGTYSSIYVAGSLSIALGLERAHLLPTPKLESHEVT